MTVCSVYIALASEEGPAGPGAPHSELPPSLGRRRRGPVPRWDTTCAPMLRDAGGGSAQPRHWGDQEPPGDPNKPCSWRCCKQEPEVRGLPTQRNISLCNSSFQSSLSIFTLSHPSSGLSVLYFEKFPAPVSPLIKPSLGILDAFWSSRVPCCEQPHLPPRGQAQGRRGWSPEHPSPWFKSSGFN